MHMPCKSFSVNTVILLAFFLCSGFTISEGASESASLTNGKVTSGFYTRGIIFNSVNPYLLALPTTFSIPINRSFFIDGTVTPLIAGTSLKESVVPRVSNTKLRLSYILSNAVLATLGVRIPTGPNEFSSAQINSTLASIGSRELGFSHANCTQALDICAGLASSIALADLGPGDLSLGLGTSFLYKGNYRPQLGVDTLFNPGDEGSFSLAGHYDFIAFDRTFSTLLDLGTTLYGADYATDKRGSRKIDNPGATFNWAFTGSTEALPGYPMNIRFANFIKGANQSASRTTGESSKKAVDLFISAQSGLPILPELSPYAKIGFSNFSGGGSAQLSNKATVFDCGAGINKRLSEHLFSVAEASMVAGSINKDNLFGGEFKGSVEYRW